MRFTRNACAALAGTLAIFSVSAIAQMTAGPRDPYTQGANSSTYDTYSSGARTSGDKFDPYTQGADQPTRQNLAPQSQLDQPAPPSMRNDRVGASAYRGDMRWNGPMLGNRLGPRNRYLDGA